MIESVELQGFKGLTRRYSLKGPTLLLGRNGAGKTACEEALVYALTRRVPAGKTLDAVSQWFGPRGGYVRVWDDEGRWIQRGIERDHRKGSVSEVLATSDDTEGQPPDLSAWRVADCTLDVREFLGLSPDKRREYILRMVGGGEWTPATLDLLEDRYAVELGGPGTSAVVLVHPWSLPPDLGAMAQAWCTQVKGRLMLRLQRPAGSLSETIQALETLAKEEISASRRTAAEGRAAATELEAAAQGARVAAGEVERRRKDVSEAETTLSIWEDLAVTYDRNKAAATKAEASQAQAAQTLAKASKQAKAASDAAALAKEPWLPGMTPNPFAKALETAKAEAEKARDLRDVVRTRTEALEENQRRHATLTAQLAEHDKMPLARLLRLVEDLPEGAHGSVPEIKALMQTLAADWRKARDRVWTEAAKIEDLVVSLAAELKSLPYLDAARTIVEMATKAYLATEEEYNKAQDAILASEHGYRDARAAWEKLNQAAFHAMAEAKSAEAAVMAATDALAEAWDAVADAEKRFAKFPKYEDLVRIREEADKALEQALKAAGSVRAYEDAIRRAEAAEVLEAAWKLTQKALKVLRDELVGGSVAEVRQDIDALLARAGRKETAYLQLENERGRPVFDLGWQLGDTRTSVAALSAGEAVIFLSALALAFLRRSDGLRILLVEGDPLDSVNLPALLGALPYMAEDLDALIVSTAQAVSNGARKGWRVVEL